jgi:hypothetical protein
MEREKPDDLIILTSRDIDWLCQEVSRHLTALDLVLGGLLPAERKTAIKNIIQRCMATLRKERES